MTSLLGDGLEVEDMAPGDGLVNELRVSYLSPERGYEMADLTPWPIPGALAEDGGVVAVQDLALPHCPSATQAMRVRSIRGRRARRQTRLSGAELPPEAFDLVAGATVRLEMPTPFDRFDGVYEAEALDPTLDVLGEGGVAMRMSATLVAHGASVYAWNAATDEEVVIFEPYDGDRAAQAMPGPIVITTGPAVDLDTGGTVIPRIRFAFLPASGADRYEWEHRPAGGEWGDGGTIDGKVRGPGGAVFGNLIAAEGVSEDIRVRAIGAEGGSDWRIVTGVSTGFVVSGAEGEAGLGGATFTGTMPPSTNGRGVRIYRAAPGAGFGTAVAVSGVLPTTPGTAFDVTVGDTTRVNLFTTPFFTSEGAWVVEPDTDIAGGVLSKTAGAATRSNYQSPAQTPGQIIRVAASVLTMSAGTVRMRSTGATIDESPARSTPGLLLGALTVPASPTRLGFVWSSPAVGSVDNAVAYVETPACLPQGAADYFVVPVTATGSMGPPSAAIPLTII